MKQNKILNMLNDRFTIETLNSKQSNFIMSRHTLALKSTVKRLECERKHMERRSCFVIFPFWAHFEYSSLINQTKQNGPSVYT
jgi:hypothetical protein